MNPPVIAVVAKNADATTTVSPCSICDQSFTLIRTKVQCLDCDFTACVTCTQTYILGQVEPRCMNPPCGKTFTREFMAKNLKKTFITNQYKKHREDVLYQRELSLLPQSQMYAKNYTHVCSLVTQRADIVRLVNQKKDEMRNMKLELIALERQKNTLDNVIRIERANIYTEHEHTLPGQPTPYGKKGPPAIARVFVRKCAFNDCLGYISPQWKCGLCEKYTCKDCHEGIREDKSQHVCKPENVASAKLIASDSRPCPKCTASIYRIDGCTAMFCTECKTCFNWATGQISNANSNPHYAEWLRSANGRETEHLPLDGCGAGIVQLNGQLNRALNRPYRYRDNHRYRDTNETQYNRYNTTPTPVFLKLLNAYSTNISHIQDIVLGQYQVNELDANQELRLQLLVKEINQEKFKTQIQRNEKKNSKKTEIYNILNFLVTTVTDMHRRINASKPTATDMDVIPSDFSIEMTNLIEYINATLLNISVVYGSTQYRVTDELEFELCVTKKEKAENAKVVAANDTDDSSEDDDTYSSSDEIKN